MKKQFLLFGIFLITSSGFSQFLDAATPAPASTTVSARAIVRDGNIGLGALTTPTSKLHIATGDVKLDAGKLFIGTPTAIPTASNSFFGIVSSKGIWVKTKVSTSLDEGSAILVSRDGLAGSATMAVAPCNGCYSKSAIVGDVVFRGNVTGSTILTNDANGTLKFETGDSRTTSTNPAKVRMMIDNIGNVGIGTGSAALAANEKLAVNGLIHTREVKIDMLNWPDYVFEKNYKLMPLSQLEKEITKNKHLPEIPAAKEVEENGVLLGEMNKKLLQKVEELTLYIIQMNKEIELLKKQSNK